MFGSHLKYPICYIRKWSNRRWSMRHVREAISVVLLAIHLRKYHSPWLLIDSTPPPFLFIYTDCNSPAFSNTRCQSCLICSVSWYSFLYMLVLQRRLCFRKRTDAALETIETRVLKNIITHNSWISSGEISVFWILVEKSVEQANLHCYIHKIFIRATNS